jgi:hypothetical protein
VESGSVDDHIWHNRCDHLADRIPITDLKFFPRRRMNFMAGVVSNQVTTQLTRFTDKENPHNEDF